jgi:DNA-binding NarL/FixJ family response regulator
MEKIKILIADDHQLFIDGIISLIDLRDNMEVVAQATCGKDIIAILTRVDVDIALLDVSMPDMNGSEVAQHITTHYPKIRVVGLSMHNQVPNILSMLRAGAKGYLLKQINTKDLLTAIETIHNGGIYYSPEVAVHLVAKLLTEEIGEKIPRNELSEREVGIIKEIVKGATNKAIALRLFISESTVKTHRQRILSKLKLTSTADLIKYALSRNIS